MSTGVSKMVAERSRRVLLELVLKPGNDVCADCRARAPRWASYNLGIFVCVSCASIHRKIGTHITKVKSITLDEWSKEQVEVMKENGNIKSNTLYNPDEARHPPPTNMIDSERDSELEKFIRSKYEFKRFMNRKFGRTSQPLKADSHAASTAPQSQSTPLTDSARIERKTSPGPPPPPKTPENLPLSLRPFLASNNGAPPIRSFSQPLPPLTNSDKLTAAPPLRQHAVTQPSVQKPEGEVWNDLISLQGPSQSSSLPLQYSPVIPFTSFPPQPQAPVQQQLTSLGGAPNPFLNSSLGRVNASAPLVASPTSISTPIPQFPLVSSAPLLSPALHLGTTNPFNQTHFAASANATALATSSNPFSSSPMPMLMAAPTPPPLPLQPVMALPTGAMLHTPPLPYAISQSSTPALPPSFPPTPFAPPATTGAAPNPFAQMGATVQMPLSACGPANPFPAMQMGQAAFSGTAFLSPQQQQQQPPLGPNRFGGWAGQGAHGSF